MLGVSPGMPFGMFAGEEFVCLGNLPREKREVQKLNRFAAISEEFQV